MDVTYKDLKLNNKQTWSKMNFRPDLVRPLGADVLL